MKLQGTGFMVTFIEVPEDLDDDLNRWYNTEHLDERINLPGFRRARRYQAIDAGIKYLTTYEATSPSAIGSPVYLKTLANPTELSAHLQARFSKAHRLLGRIVVDRTHGYGAFLATVRFTPDPATAQDLEDWFGSNAFDEIGRMPGVTGWCVAAALPEAEERMAAGLGLEHNPDLIPEWSVLVEGTSTEATREAASRILAEVDQRGIAGPILETYRFLYGNARLGDDDRA